MFEFKAILGYTARLLTQGASKKRLRGLKRATASQKVPELSKQRTPLTNLRCKDGKQSYCKREAT